MAIFYKKPVAGEGISYMGSVIDGKAVPIAVPDISTTEATLASTPAGVTQAQAGQLVGLSTGEINPIITGGTGSSSTKPDIVTSTVINPTAKWVATHIRPSSSSTSNSGGGGVTVTVSAPPTVTSVPIVTTTVPETSGSTTSSSGSSSTSQKLTSIVGKLAVLRPYIMPISATAALAISGLIAAVALKHKHDNEDWF